MEVRGCQGEEQAPEGCHGPPRRPARCGQGCRGVGPALRGGGAGSPPGVGEPRPACVRLSRFVGALLRTGPGCAGLSGELTFQADARVVERPPAGSCECPALTGVPALDPLAAPRGWRERRWQPARRVGEPRFSRAGEWDGFQRAPRLFPFLVPRCAEPHRSPRDPWWEGWKHVFEGTWLASSHSLRSLTESFSLQSNLIIFMEHLLYVRLCPWHCASVSLAVKWDRSTMSEGCGGNGISCV